MKNIQTISESLCREGAPSPSPAAIVWAASATHPSRLFLLPKPSFASHGCATTAYRPRQLARHGDRRTRLRLRRPARTHSPSYADGRGFAFAEGAETKGNERKKTGSYYTPDSLVQALLDSALDPVLDRVEERSRRCSGRATWRHRHRSRLRLRPLPVGRRRRIATRVARVAHRRRCLRRRLPPCTCAT